VFTGRYADRKDRHPACDGVPATRSIGAAGDDSH
jgi:hypothetical protein